MKNFEMNRVAERGHMISQRIQGEYGALAAPEVGIERGQARQHFLALLRRGHLAHLSEDITLIKPQDPANLIHLTGPHAIGRMFGIMSKNKIVHTGIITDRTIPGELHFTRLSGGGVALENFQGVDDLGRMTAEVGGLMQHPETGTAAADTRKGAVAEIGHTMQALSALTDPTVFESLQVGTGHLVHDWATTGIASALTNRATGVSAFRGETASGPIENGFAPEIVITTDTQGLILVDHINITDERPSEHLQISSAEMAVGLGMLAAESQLEQSGTALEEQMMRVAERM